MEETRRPQPLIAAAVLPGDPPPGGLRDLRDRPPDPLFYAVYPLLPQADTVSVFELSLDPLVTPARVAPHDRLSVAHALALGERRGAYFSRPLGSPKPGQDVLFESVQGGVPDALSILDPELRLDFTPSPVRMIPNNLGRSAHSLVSICHNSLFTRDN